MFQRIQNGDQSFSLLQDSIQKAFNQSEKATSVTFTLINGVSTPSATQIIAPFFNGNLVTVSLTSAQDNLIPHLLKKTPTVWILASQDTSATVWSPTTASLKNSAGINQSANDQYINLHCSSSCNIKFWVT